MPIDIDFRKDYELIMKEELRTVGIVIDQTIPYDDIPYIYHNFMKRNIKPQPRNILKASDFNCPTDLIPGLDNLERKIISGDDLKPHLSKSVFTQYEGTDYLLNDWGVHHLHLGITIENGFVKRTNSVLFCIVTENTIYFITIKEHKKWHEQDILKTVYINWVELIEPFIMNGVISVVNKPTDDNVKSLRYGHIMYPIEIDTGVVIYPPGGGYTTDGTSNEVVKKVFSSMRIITNFEEKIKANENNIRRYIIKKNKTPAKTMKFKLEFKNDNMIAYEVYSKVLIPYDAELLNSQ